MQNCASVSGWHTHEFPEQVVPAPQLPQLTARIAPQLSTPVFVPHAAPNRAQNCASLSGWHTQAFPEQLVPAPHWPPLGPQVVMLPHAFVALPHCAFAGQTGAGQAHWLLVLQTRSLEQPPQLSVRITPQLSTPDLAPHPAPSRAQKACALSGWHTEQVPDTLHVPCEHEPQSIVRDAPQRSVSCATPHWRPEMPQSC